MWHGILTASRAAFPVKTNVAQNIRRPFLRIRACHNFRHMCCVCTITCKVLLLKWHIWFLISASWILQELAITLSWRGWKVLKFEKVLTILVNGCHKPAQKMKLDPISSLTIIWLNNNSPFSEEEYSKSCHVRFPHKHDVYIYLSKNCVTARILFKNISRNMCFFWTRDTIETVMAFKTNFKLIPSRYFVLNCAHTGDFQVQMVSHLCFTFLLHLLE